MEKVMVFKESFSGTGKKSEKPFTMIELHDPSTLENAKFFLRQDQVIDTSKMKFKDEVIATFEMGIQNGTPRMELASLNLV
ncbi:hypothetical protein [Paenibacillus gallinarum]|uniref:Uncharacterized protein n=1 Tax=Paenibacillus gallinarum TaxID=2762232 RepID=A0ABR8T6H8_9BACL|nr:hypothetical protein [Paenibacillus gallinarum]MBD7971371.1 hypothetical protein [Paenibacillus gallinarum]